MTAQNRRRMRASQALLTVTAIVACVGLACTVMTVTAEGGAFPPEAVLLPAMLATLFAMTWWLVAAALLTGLLLAIRTRPRLAWWTTATVAVCALLSVIALQWMIGLFPWPFPALSA
jgi:spore maturation protein SpmA